MILEVDLKIFDFLKPDKNRFSIMIYAVLTVILSYAGIQLLSFSTDIFNWITGVFNKLYSWIYPAIIGIILAYLIFPIVNFIFKYISKIKYINEKIAKYLSITLAYLFIILIIFGFFYAIYISIGGQISNNTNLNQIITFISDFANTDSNDANAFKISALFEQAGINVSISVASKIAEFLSVFKQWFYTFISSLGTTLINLSESIFSWGIGLILSVYLVKDSNYFISLGKRIYFIIFGNSAVGRRINVVLTVFDKTFKRYIKGQCIEAFFVAVLSVFLLKIFGIKYFLLIGIVSGITNMIPYVGPIMGTLLAVVMGLLDGSISNAIIGFIIMVVVQQIDNNIMAPKIVGGMVGLHPVFIIVALIIGGKFGGLFGMVLAIPIAATIKLLFNQWYINTGKDDTWTIFRKDISDEDIEKEVDSEFKHKKPYHVKSLKLLKSLNKLNPASLGKKNNNNKNDSNVDEKNK